MTESRSSPIASTAHLLRPDLRKSYPVFVRGDGVELISDEGHRYLDAISGVGVTCLGYSATEVAEAVALQAQILPYVHTLRFETQPMRQLADLIADIAPGELSTVFFVSGGSEANETAFKFARQYWLEEGSVDKWKVIGRRPSYHGNTLATLSASWHIGRRQRHAPLLLKFPHTVTPNSYRGCTYCSDVGGKCSLACADELDEVIRHEGPETVAAFISEPVVGAAGGALVAPPGYYDRIRDICDQQRVLLISDEVITGFGRTGRWFGFEHFGVQPDIITFAKGVSAGYAPLGGLVVSNTLLAVFRAGSGKFEHNFTMAGHPIACAAGLATVTILRRDAMVERVAAMESAFFGRLHEALDDVAIVGDIRGLGLLAGIELVADRATKRPFDFQDAVSSRAAACALDERINVYPCSGGVEGGEAGDYLLIMPPFVTSEDELDEMVSRVGKALHRLSDEVL